MKKDEVIELAKEADVWVAGQEPYQSQLEAFAKLIAAKEREACANMCDLAILQNQEAINELEDDEHIAKCFIQGAMTQLVKTSKAIRARGNT
jgi:hypothetical protein